jgi:RES domain
MSDPGPHPEPPSDFHRRTLPIVTQGGSLFRTHPHTAAPFYFGRTGRNRFDDPDGQYSVLYAARDVFGAFIETFGQQTGVRSVGVGDLKVRRLTEFYPASPLLLVDLVSPGCLARMGADSRLFAGSRAVAQRWSRAIYEHPDLPVHGILYPARHNHTRCAVAIFDRDSVPRLEITRSVSWYSDEEEQRSNLAAVLNLYGFSLVETGTQPDKKNPGTASSLQFDLFDE